MEGLLRGGWFLQSCAAEYDDSRVNPLFTLDQLGFQKFEPDADGAKFFSLEKFCVSIGGNVRGGFCCGVEGI